MPFITQKRRHELINDAENAGELNYLITVIIHDYIRRIGLRYETLNEAIGVLECTKASLIQTVLTPYENKKMKENGNISELDKEYLEYQQVILEDLGE